MASCVMVAAIVCVLITTVGIIVAFATPNWAQWQDPLISEVKRSNSLCQCLNCDCGLWLHCIGGVSNDGSIDNCNWFFADDFEIEKTLPDWFKAVQGLMSCAVASSLLSLLIGLISLCCYCKSCNPHKAAGAFINLTFLLVTAAVCVYGAKGHIDYDLDVLNDDNSERVRIFGWSFWVAVGSGATALLSSVLYCCVGRKDDYV